MVLTQRAALLDHVLPATKDGAAIAFEVKKDQFLRITGRSTVVFVAFNLHNVKERFDQARTRNNNRRIYPFQGGWIFTKDNTIMLTVVEDTWKWRHDLQVGLCTRKSLELLFKREGHVTSRGYEKTPYPLRWERQEDIPARGCREDLAEVLAPWGVPSWEVPSPLNLFQNMTIDGETGLMAYDHPEPAEDAVVTMRAEMDLLVGIGQHWGTTSRVQVLEGWPPAGTGTAVKVVQTKG